MKWIYSKKDGIKVVKRKVGKMEIVLCYNDNGVPFFYNSERRHVLYWADWSPTRNTGLATDWRRAISSLHLDYLLILSDKELIKLEDFLYANFKVKEDTL